MKGDGVDEKFVTGGESLVKLVIELNGGRKLNGVVVIVVYVGRIENRDWLCYWKLSEKKCEGSR